MLHVEREQNYFHSLLFPLLSIVSAILFGCQIVGMLLVFLAWVKTTLFQIKKHFVPKSTASLSASRHAVMFTLKQTHRENGSVTITMAQETAVRSQPQIPMPTSLSWATRKEREKEKKSCRPRDFFSRCLSLWRTRIKQTTRWKEGTVFSNGFYADHLKPPPCASI